MTPIVISSDVINIKISVYNFLKALVALLQFDSQKICCLTIDPGF